MAHRDPFSTSKRYRADKHKYSRELVDHITADWKLLKRVLEEIAHEQGRVFVLKQKGTKNYVTSCPLHKESTPSFQVKLNDDGYVIIFKCFGCGKHGNVLSLYREAKRFSFWKVMKLLSKDPEYAGLFEKDKQKRRTE